MARRYARIGFVGAVWLLVAVRADYPSVAALHPLNGFSILLVTIVLGRDGWRLVRADRANVSAEG